MITSVAQRIGLDIGAAPVHEARIQAAADAGARMVRLRFALGDRSHADDDFLDEARQSVMAARGARFRVLGVLDGGLTVAPAGAGAWSDDSPPALAAAWVDELAGNASRLVESLSGLVAAWEIAPTPNLLVNGERRISPARWAAMLGAVGPRVRAADPGASIVAGGLVSDEFVDGVTYFRQAAEAGAWPSQGAPFDAIGLALRVAPEGGGSEGIVKTLVSERAQRLWRAAVALIGEDRIDGLWVTSVGWDAVKAGESAQARNLWTTCDTLTADPLIRSVIWSSLVDTEGASGLYAASDLSPDSRRPAWKAFNDFAVYAAQIGVASNASLSALVPEPETELESAIPTKDEIEIEIAAEEIELGSLFDDATDMDSDSEPIEAELVDPVPVEMTPIDSGADGSELGSPGHVGTPASRITFRVPRILDLLQASGLEGKALEQALDAVAARYGSREWLPAGEYEIEIADRSGDRLPDEGAASIDRPTNQHVLSAFYRAGGGTWSLLAKAGLDLADLVTARGEPYKGPAIETLSRLDRGEVESIVGELEFGL